MCMPICLRGQADRLGELRDPRHATWAWRTAGSIGFLNPNVFADGITVSMEKVGENDRFFPWYEMRMRSRTRTPEYVLGDARGRLAGCITIRERLYEVIEKYGLDFFLDAGKEYVEDSRRYAVARVKTQAVPGRIRKSQFKDLAMKGKRVLDPKQDIDCLFNLPMELTVNADASVKPLAARRERHGALRREHQPDGAQIGPAERLLAHRRLRHVQLRPHSAWNIEMPPDGSWANPFRKDFFASSGVAWAPAVIWMSSLYEVFGRLFQMRGFVEEMAAGSGTIMTAEFSGINQLGHVPRRV